jgi:hypothetical protein
MQLQSRGGERNKGIREDINDDFAVRRPWFAEDGYVEVNVVGDEKGSRRWTLRMRPEEILRLLLSMPADAIAGGFVEEDAYAKRSNLPEVIKGLVSGIMGKKAGKAKN